MTEYVIQGKYLFNADLFILSDLSTGEVKVRLNSPASKCLLKLIEAGGDIISREELLAECWKNLVVTPNSLNQVITSLRRTFRELDAEGEAIVTVARRGYRLSHTLDVRPSGQPAHGQTDIFCERPAVTVEPSSLAESVSQRWRVIKAIAIATGLLFPVTALAVLLYSYLYYPRIEYIHVARIQDVDISVQQGLEQNTLYISESVRLLNEDTELSARLKDHRYVYLNKTVKANIRSFFFCPQPISESIRGCESFTMVGDYE